MKTNRAKWFLLYPLFLQTFSEVIAQSPDPNFHIYICFGQSNMEGQGPIETQDRTVDSRFQIMQAVSCTNQPAGKWRTATPPLARCNTKLGPPDYFGREMVKNLPSNIKVGIVFVAVAGCKIELFDKANYVSYANSAESWMKSIITEYGGNPYGKMIELAKLAQKDGVIKGILLHQGESNTGDTDAQWANKVKGVYTNMLTDLNLTANDVPLLAGEVVQGGLSASANSHIDNLPKTIPTSYVISSSGLGAQSDNLHFTSASYRTLGIRYATQMLKLLNLNTCATPAPTVTSAQISYEVGDVASPLSATGTSLKWYTEASGGTAQINAPTPSTVTAGTKTYYVSQTGSGCESSRASITVTVTSSYKISKTDSPIVIDGSVDDIWSNASSTYAVLGKTLTGTISSASDLSASFKAMWDDTYLYVLANVTDQTLNNDSQNSYDDDAVEVYVDINNDKAATYGANDVQYTFGWNDGTTVGTLPTGRSTAGITYKVVDKIGGLNGYIMEARIPWSTLQGSPVVNQSIGIEFMLNDDDNGGTRDKKLAWSATSDDAWEDPSLFGVAKLVNTPIATDIDNISLHSESTILCYPNPSTSGFTIVAKSSFSYQLMNQIGQLLKSGQANETVTLSDEFLKGIYLLQVTQEGKTSIVKLVKD